MDYFILKKYIIEVYKYCNVQSFPINCFDLLKKYGYMVLTYEELKNISSELYELCSSYSEDAMSHKDYKIAAYNSSQPYTRIRFSLMHELAHIVVEKAIGRNITEGEADFFASNILAPRMAIHYSKCRNASDVSRFFGMSKEAAEYAYENYISWYKFIQRNNNHMTTLDRAMYYQFYDNTYEKFVYCRKECRHCGKEYVNSEWRICEKCKRIAEIRGNMHDSYEDDINMLNKWIYNMNKKQGIL